MQIGVLGGTGAAGSAVSARLAAVGVEVVLGSRTEERAAEAVDEITKRWTGYDLTLVPATNQVAAQADLVVLATPVEGAVNTVGGLVDELSGKILVTMVNAMVRWGDRVVPLLPYTGSVAVALSRVIPATHVAGAFHHLPAGPLGDPSYEPEADVMVFSDVPSVTDEVIRVVGLIPGLHGVDVGGLGSALAVEALTACLVEINRRYKTHASLRVTGIV
ncbi:MAG: NAD(P)-binding domain-containing protein [Acidimicrobiales bacterium]